MRAYIWGILFLSHGYLAAMDSFVEQSPNVTLQEESKFDLRLTDEQFNNALGFLGELVAIPSVSNPNSPDYNYDTLARAAHFIESKLQDLGFKVSCPSIDGSPPYVLAELFSDTAKPTLLLYGHYDVQPVNREKWNSDPFIMQERDGRLYGRGASDDKGGIVAIIAALEAYKKSAGELPVNIKLLFEGEEEFGSSHMQPLLEQKAEQLQADALIVVDGLNRDVDTGTLTSSSRGLVNLKLKVNALEKPIHSGIGCLVPDPAQALAGLVYLLRDPKAIPGFMETIQPLSEEEREILAKSSQSAESYAMEMGVLKNALLRGDPNVSIYERIVQEPSISIVNMNCGQPNGGNSIQESASCTIGIRIVHGQDPQHVADVVSNYLKSHAIMYNLPIEISKIEKGAWAWKAELARPFAKKYMEALAENFDHSSAMPCGGALPLLREFKDAFPNMEVLVPGVEDPQTSAHSHNESQDILLFRNSINTLISFLNKAGAK